MIDLIWMVLFLLYYFIFWIEDRISYKKYFFVIFSLLFVFLYIIAMFISSSNVFLIALLKYSFIITILFFIYLIISIFYKKSLSINDFTLSYAIIIYFLSRLIIHTSDDTSFSSFLMMFLYGFQKFIYIVNLLIQTRRFIRFLRKTGGDHIC